jgi:phosphomannomutase
MAEGLKFGTSGLRGLVTELEGWPTFAYTRAFAEVMLADGLTQPGGAVLVGRDLRPSSPAIAGTSTAALRTSGLDPIDCGPVPTPALAQASLERGLPAIMVTGSHIPDDRNGLKFYRPDGEITKDDESVILSAFARLAPPSSGSTSGVDLGAPSQAPSDAKILGAYARRFQNFFGSDALAGLTIGVYQHSTVCRDLMVEILTGAGATAVPLSRSDRFVPVDTEALRPEDVTLARGWASAQRLDAIVSADGDADRPLVADETGTFIRGDLLGLLTALHLGADAVVTPVTSNSAIDRAGIASVRRTRVGSPHVIAGMEDAIDDGFDCVLGFEANGGVLLGSTIVRKGRLLEALPTRDAILPILSVLALARQRGVPLSHLIVSLKATAMAAHRLQNVPAEKSTVFLQRLAEDAPFAAMFLGANGPITGKDLSDGVRLTLSSGEVLHYRASGNAPELRCYVEAADQTRADALLAWGLKAAAVAL